MVVRRAAAKGGHAPGLVAGLDGAEMLCVSAAIAASCSALIASGVIMSTCAQQKPRAMGAGAFELLKAARRHPQPSPLDLCIA
jgi:hypothetical protein